MHSLEERIRREGNNLGNGILKVDGVNRVVYDIISKPPGTIEWE